MSPGSQSLKFGTLGTGQPEGLIVSRGYEGSGAGAVSAGSRTKASAAKLDFQQVRKVVARDEVGQVLAALERFVVRSRRIGGNRKDFTVVGSNMNLLELGQQGYDRPPHLDDLFVASLGRCVYLLSEDETCGVRSHSAVYSRP